MNSKITNGLLWRSLEGVGVQAAQFIIQLVLARILMPADFGVVAILNIFVNLANTLVQNGLSSAILQKKEPEEKDFYTVFWTENGIAIIMYAIIFVCSPWIAGYYNNPELTLYLRVFATTIIFSSIGSMQTTVLRYRMDFKSSFWANSIGIILQGIVGIGMALAGFGVWSLIISQIVYRLVLSAFLFRYARFVPKFIFSFARLKELFGFSWKLAAGWIIGTIYNDVLSLVIGKEYSEEVLGYYSRGNSIPNVINRVMTQITTSVMFPAISKIQDDDFQVKRDTRLMMAVSAALIFPALGALAGMAKPLVLIVLTEKWLPSVPIVQIFCIPMAINVVSNANMQTFNALGRSDIFLKIEFIKRALTIGLVIIFAKIDFYLMLWSIASMGFISLFINLLYNIRLLGYSIKEQIFDLLPGVLVGLIVFFESFIISLKIANEWTCIILQSVVVLVTLAFVLLKPVGIYKKIAEVIRKFTSRWS